MIELLLAFVSAFWLGILTAISPCPMATNIAAVSFLSRTIERPRQVFWSGMAYAAGRMLAYAALGILIISSLLNIPVVSHFLQKYMNRILGPLLIVTGLFLLDLFTFRIPGFSMSRERHERLSRAGAGGAFLLGAVFALAFCPVSAAIFFGSLIPLSLETAMGVALPFVYGIATGLPVLIFAVMISLGVTSAAKMFQKAARLEKYARKVTAVLFIFAGLYYIYKYIIPVH